VVLLIVFFAVEARTESPLINVRIFRNQTFTVENIIIGTASAAFIPVFFFVAIYGQIALDEKADTASLRILWFFLGFVVAAQIGGRLLDRIGAKPPVVLGSVLAATGFGLWASGATDPYPGIWPIVMAGAGMGLMLGQANTDAINRASRYSYGEATGITQTVRNYGASLGFAILGTLLITRFKSAITASLTGKGLPGPAASTEAAKIAQLQGGNSNSNITTIPAFIRDDFAAATRDVLYGMAVIMAVAALVALLGLRRGVQEDTAQGPEELSSQLPGEDRAPTATRPGAKPGRNQ
jgi:MFS family permease